MPRPLSPNPRRPWRTFVALGIALVSGCARPPEPPVLLGATFDLDTPRLVVLTDHGGDPDDLQSMVRLLTYANELDLEGLVATSSAHVTGGVRPDLIEERVRGYGEVLANLRAHDPDYPDMESLLGVVRAGNPRLGMDGVGPGQSSAGSRHLIDVVDRADPRPVWVSIWGGANVLAQALHDVRASRSPEEVERFVSKLRVYSISDQDDSGPWARAEFPKLFWVTSVHGFLQYELSTWNAIGAPTPGADQSIVGHRWLNENVRSHGPLGALYPRPAFIMEGDTPSFLHLVQNGLGSPEHPDWGSWGGRYGQLAPFLGLWTDVRDAAVGIDGEIHTSNKATLWRWRPAFQNDFAARMDWSITPDFADANHPPTPRVNGEGGLAPVRISVCPDEKIALSAADSTDPDGDALRHRWFWYREAAGYTAQVVGVPELADGETTELVVPTWRHPHEVPVPDSFVLHAILETTDDGTPPLTRYRRILVEVPTDGRGSDRRESCPVVETAPAPSDTSIFIFDAPGQGSSGAWYSTYDTPIGELIEVPAAHAILEKHVPAPIFERFSDASVVHMMTLRIVQQVSGGALSNELLDAIDADLATLPAPAAEKGSDTGSDAP